MNYVSNFFSGEAFHKQHERMHVKSLYFLESQIIIAVVELYKGICQNVHGEITSVIKSLIKSHKDLEGTDLFSRRYFRKNLV